MAQRNGLAVEFEAAPLVRLRCETAVIAAGATLEITDRIPYKELIDGAPYVNLIMAYLINDTDEGPCICVGSAATLAQATYQRLNRAAGFSVVRVRKLLPRQATADTTLIDGNRVFIFNRDDAQYTVQLIVEAPSLNWV